MIGLADFIGDWTVARRISDRRAGQDSRFDGQARFQPCKGGLSYVETGHLTMPDSRVFAAERRYFWRDMAGRIAVQFDDGRDFHSFDPGRAAPAAHHQCGADSYGVQYDFAPWPRWSARWQVSGPRKDYVMVSCYAPCAGAETWE